MSAEHTIKFQLGDWSKDGHNQHLDIFVTSNKPVADVREAYFTAVTKTGFDFGAEVCKDYEESTIPEHHADTLTKLGWEFSDYEKNELETEGRCYLQGGTQGYLEILLWYLKLGDLELTLTVNEVIDTTPTFHFSGYDEKKRHIPMLAYGMFY